MGDYYYDVDKYLLNCDNDGIQKEREEVVNWYRKAAEQGYMEAQCRLGECYEDEASIYAALRYVKMSESGRQKDYFHNEGPHEHEYECIDQAIMWYRKAAERGYAEAQCLLGDCYCNNKMDDQEGVNWYRKAVEQDYAKAKYALGQCYHYGVGVEESQEEAVKWYCKAAEQGYAEAQYELGEAYREGCGIGKNDEEAVKWYRKAAEQKTTSALSALEHYYHEKAAGYDEQEIQEYRKRMQEMTDFTKEMIERAESND